MALLPADSLSAVMSFNDEAMLLRADFPAHRITTVRHGARGMRYVVERTDRSAGGPLVFVTDSADEVRQVLGGVPKGTRP